MPNTIVVKGPRIRKERIATAAITPGMLLETNAADEVQPHATASAAAQIAVAVEYEVIGRDQDQVYAVDDRVLYEILQRGTEFYGYVAAGAVAIVAGAMVRSDGAGGFLSGAAGVGSLGVALEAVDNSGGAEYTRVLIEAL